MMYLYGQWIDKITLTVTDAEEIISVGRTNSEALSKYPLSKILDLFSKLQEAWSDPDLPEYKEALEKLPQYTGFSKEMIEMALKALSGLLDPFELEKKVNNEFRGLGDQWTTLNPTSDTELIWSPIGVVLHVISGNVFLAGVGSLIEGLLTRNITILKMSSSETLFLPLFMKVLNRMDRDQVVSKSISIIQYRSSQIEVMEKFKSSVDGLVVWGGEDAVRAYRNNLPAHTRIVVFGPKLSLGYIGKNGDFKNVVEGLAKDLAIWDQRACTAPQLVYVESKSLAQDLIKKLDKVCEEIAKTLPAGEIDTHTAVEIRKIRTVAEVEEAKKLGHLAASKDNLSWTLYLSQDREITPSPLQRTLKIVPIEKIDEALIEIKKLKGYIQSVGLSVGKEESSEISKKLVDAGVVRIVPFGQMAGGQTDDPHDGQYDLPQLMNLSFLRRASGQENRSFEYLSVQSRNQILEGKLARLLMHAKRSEFYSKRLKNLDISSIEDWTKIPPLKKEEMQAGMPPFSEALLTKDQLIGGYVSRSGGTTGDPKFSVYDGEDWKAMINHAAKIFKSMGLAKGDRIANFMLAGDLYGGFVSFDQVGSALGLMNFGFAGKYEMDTFYKVWKEFKINVIEGVPAAIMPFLRELKVKYSDFTIEKLVYAGGPLAPLDRSWIKAELNARLVVSVIGANDGGHFAYQCPYQEGQLHHTIDDFNYLEIVDENGKPVSKSESGRILITSWDKLAYPLIRYEIGDAGRFVNQSCKCGRTSRVFEYQGRIDDFVTVGLMNLSLGQVDKVLSSQPISEYQIGVGSVEGRDQLSLSIETESKIDSEVLKKHILKFYPEIDKNIKEGNISNFSIEMLSLGSLERNERTGKIKRVVDERL